jgi:glycosyltransferase involved in cell wall biosynthesis
MLIIGDGAKLEELQATAAAQGLDDVVTFTGRIPHEEVERYYSIIDVTPFPRLPLPVCEMVSPLKPFEAMAMGKAVIASDVAALAEIVTPGRNGLLHVKGSAESLTEQVEHLLDDPELRARLGVQARDWVVAERDWKQLASTVARTYEDVVR